MGTEMQFKSYMPGYCSMRDLNEDANGYINWTLHYRDRPLPNGKFYNCSHPSATADLFIGYDKDSVKQKMLEHEAIFKQQVYELHRLYRIQKDLMDEIRRKEMSSSPIASHSFLPEDARKWQSPGYLSNCGRPSVSGSEEASCSPMKSLKGHNSQQASPLKPQTQDGCTSKGPGWLESGPSKVRRRMFDLSLPADRYIDPDELKPFKGETYCREDKAVADLNKPIHIEDTNMPLHTQANTLLDGKIMSKDLSSECGNGTLSNWHTVKYGGGSSSLSHVINAGQVSGDLKHALQGKVHESLMHLPAHTLNQHKVSVTSDWAKSSPHPLSAWERPSGYLTQKSISVEVGPCPDSYSIHHRNFQSPPLGHGMLGERWRQSGGRPDLGFGNKSSLDRIGFSPVSSSSGPKGISSRRDDQNSVDVKPSTAMDLNRVFSDGEELQEDHFAILPWIKARMYQKGEVTANADSDFKEKLPLQSMNNQLTGRGELCERSRNTKVLEIPIFREPPVPRKELSSLAGKSDKEIAGGRNMRMLDINLPCDQVPELSNSISKAPLVLENKEVRAKSSGLKCEIDLNSCADEGESVVSTADGASGRKISVIIDLEAPPCLEMEEISYEDEKHIQSPHRKIEHLTDESKIAAEAIVAISSSVLDLPKPSSAENLMWFASIVLKETKVRGFTFPSQGIDYFESMTLKLTEMEDEEHLSQPLVPLDTLKLREEDSVASTSAANHRPQRRGRQRGDFQRDILPGLTTLSRHEVMEDMQIFGGIMRATGHTWISGPTRRKSSRNRSARPRRRKITSCPSPPVVNPAYTPPLNLTGWGKTRRPRRQRCPAPPGNLALIQLT